MTYPEWLAGLKVDSEVFVSQRFGVPETGRVKRLTKTQIVVVPKNMAYERKFWRESGRKVGDSGYNTSRLVQPSDEVTEQIEIAQLKTEARALRDKLAIPASKQSLLKFVTALKALTEEK